MKIYRTRVIARGLTGEQATRMLARCPGLGFEPCGIVSIRDDAAIYRGIGGLIKYWPRHTNVAAFNLTRRCEFIREWHLDGKALLKMLPEWAKHHVPRNIGVKVTEFYALNDKVVTRLHHSGFVVGSPEFYDWQETQPDPFRSADAYRRAIGELRC